MIGIDWVGVAVAVFTGLTAFILFLEYRVKKKRQRVERLKEKLKIGRELVRVQPEEPLLSALGKGNIPNPETGYIRDLALLLDYGKDQVLQEDINRLLLVFNNVQRGTVYPEDPAKEVVEVYKRVQERVSWDIAGWEQELQQLSK